ncbi:MAG: low temperature requirement protein A [Actinomycetota bacterium]|nr:low temperature requirement protein A [Actinomycetota bacterium]
MTRFQRERTEGEEQRATTLELFYDLAFVFAITQVSHLLLDNLTWTGVGQAALVLLVVWWAWNYTTWVTNELDPDSTAVRVVVLGIMLASLVMAVAIPEAFGAHGLLFAGSYVAIQIGRHTFLTFVSAYPGTIERERAGRILAWFVPAGALWIAGGLADGSERSVLWVAALAIDYLAPLVLYWIPGRAPLSSDTWSVETSHFAERFQLFVIIALGETIVITGTTTSELDLDVGVVAAFVLAFLGTAALWWLYFSYVATIAQRRLALSEDSTRLARDAYTYLHAGIIGGIVLSAVGDELVIAHPTEELPGAELAVVVSGPALYLFAHVAVRLRMTGTISGKLLAGALACLAVGGVGLVAPALVVGALLVGVLVAVIVVERVADARRRTRGEPSPLERLETSARS